MSNGNDLSGRRSICHSDGVLHSGKSYASASTTESQVKSHWDSSRSNHQSLGIASFSSQELSNNREIMKNYLADRNTTNVDVGIVPGLHKNDDFRSSYKPSVRVSSMNTTGDTINLEGLNNSANYQSKAPVNCKGEGNHWPFSFSSKGPKTKRDDQNAYRRELDRQIQHKKLIREQETEQLKKISRQRNSETPTSAKSSGKERLPWLSKSEENTQNCTPREVQARHHLSNPELSTQVPLEQIIYGNAHSNPNFAMPNVNGATIDPNFNASQAMYIQQQPGPVMNTSGTLGLPNFINLATIPSPSHFQSPQMPNGLVKDMNTGIVYQPISPMPNPQLQQPYIYPAQQPQTLQMNPQQPPLLNQGASVQAHANYPSGVENNDQERETPEHCVSNSKSHKADSLCSGTNSNQEDESREESTNFNTEYKPHVSESSAQRPESSVLRSKQKLILDRQMQEKRYLEEQRKAKELEEEQMLQRKIKLDQEKMQRELEQEMKMQKEKEEAKRLRQEKAFQKEEQLRKETEERRAQEKEKRRRTLIALAEQDKLDSAEVTLNEMRSVKNKEMESDEEIESPDDRPLPIRYREASTQSAESSSQESICVCCSVGRGRGEISSAVTLHAIPEIEHQIEVEVEVEPLLVNFTTALALESDRMKKMLNSLESKQKIRQI